MKPYLFLIVLLCAACVQTGTPPPEREQVVQEADAAASTVQGGFGHAVLTPARDLNLMREPIPPELLAIEHAYAVEPRVTCEAIAEEVTTLDEALGPDVDTDADGAGSGKAAGDFIIDALSDTAGGIIPFRGLVRRATGAHDWDRRLKEAYVTGLLRRAHLKGMGRMLGCEPPASPRPPASDEADQ